MGSALFMDFIQRRILVLNPRVGTTYRSHPPGSGSPRLQVLKDVTIGCPKRPAKSTIPHSVKFRKSADLS